jgi:hypothetical protein
MSVSDREAYEKKKAWKEKSNMEIRGMLARVVGKHRELCLEAQSRISKQDQNYAVFERGTQLTSCRQKIPSISLTVAEKSQ